MSLLHHGSKAVTSVGRFSKHVSRGDAAAMTITQQKRSMNQLISGDLPDDQSDEEEDKRNLKHPWRILLEPTARATWRASGNRPPEALAEVQFNLIQETRRTSKQLRRTYLRVVQSHNGLAERRERERRREKNPKYPSDSLAYKKDMNQDKSVSPVYYSPEASLSSLRFRLYPNYSVVKRVLMETQSLIGPDRWKPTRMIDFGIGCGSASVAALDVFDSIDWVHGVDPSQSMQETAERVLNDVTADRTTPPRVTLSGSLSTERTNSSTSGFDLAVCAYTAMELPHVASSLAAAAVLWEKLRPNGVFVMIEPGTPDGFNSIRSARTMLLDCCPPDRFEEPGDDQCHIIAPCTHNGTCPMERHARLRKSDIHNQVNAAQKKDDKFEESEEDVLDEDEVDNVGRNDSDDDDDDDDDIESDDDWEGDDEQGRELYQEIVAPNGTMAETDVFKSAFCSFVHSMAGGTRKNKGEKFSYFVAQKRIVGDTETDDVRLDHQHNPFHDANVTELLANAFQAAPSGKVEIEHSWIDAANQERQLEQAQLLASRFEKADDQLGLDLLRGDSKRKSFGRIIRAPIKRRGHVLVDYCSASDLGQGDGRIVRHNISKGFSARVAPGLFAAARKSRWGGLWPDVMERRSPLTKRESLSYSPEKEVGG